MNDQTLQSTSNSPSYGRRLNQINSLSSAGKELIEIIDQEIKILLIEDNPADVRMIQELVAEVKSAHLDLEFVDRLSEGLERLGSPNIDAILLDLSLPDSQGARPSPRLSF